MKLPDSPAATLPPRIHELAEWGCRLIPIHWVHEDGLCSCMSLDCKSPGKHAIWTGWQERATSDPKVIARWIRLWNGLCNFGWVMSDDYIALDLDEKEGRNGIQTLKNLEHEHGPLPRSCCASTPTGGGHIVLKAPAEWRGRLRPSGKDWRSGIEVRAGNSYIVVEPSKTKLGQYRFWQFDEPGLCPEWLLGMLPQAKEGAPQEVGFELDEAAELPVQAATLLTKVSQFQALWEQKVDKLGDDSPSGWDHALATAYLRIHANASNQELADIVCAYRREKNDGWGKRKTARQRADYIVRTITSARESATLPVPEGNGSRPFTASGVTLEGFDALLEPGPIWAQKAGEKVPVIVRGFLAASGVAMMIADPKAGKTWMVMELLIGVTCNVPIFGQYPVEKAGRVLYIATEGTREGTLARLRGLSLGRAVGVAQVLEGIDFVWRRGVQLDDPDFVKWVVSKAADYTLIVVDVLAEAWTGDESRPAQVSKLLRAVREITNNGPTVLLLHHLSKEQAEDQRSIWQRIRGSTAFYGGFDSGIGLERSITGKRTKVSFQHRDDVPLAGFSFTWPEELVTGEKAVSLDWQQEESDLAAQHALEPRVLELTKAEPGLSMNQVVVKLGTNRRTTLAAIKALLGTSALRKEEGTYTRKDGRLGTREGLYVVVPASRNQEEPSGTSTSRVLVPRGIHNPPIGGGIPPEPGTTTAVPGTGTNEPGTPRLDELRQKLEDHLAGENGQDEVEL